MNWVFALTAVLLTATPPPRATAPHTYRNVDYGFRLSLPVGITPVVADPPAPNHGFLVSVPHTDSTIWISAYYASAGEASAHDAATELLSPISLSDPRIQVTSTRLAGLKAIRLNFGEGTPPIHREVVLAFRATRGGTGILYTLDLRASPHDYDRSAAVLEKLRKGFRLTYR